MYIAPLCNFIFPRELWFLMIFIVSHSLCSKFFINELIVVYTGAMSLPDLGPKKSNTINLEGEACGWLEWQWASKTTALTGSHPCTPAQPWIVQYQPAQGNILREAGPSAVMKDMLVLPEGPLAGQDLGMLEKQVCGNSAYTPVL